METARIAAMGLRAPAGSRPRARWRQDLVMVGLGAAVIGAQFTDGWAHINVPELEGFFTPWHAALYGAFTASVAWVAWLGSRARPDGGGVVLPVGYGLGAWGIVIFAAGGAGDMVWHEIFGVEAGVDALLSPTHLVLLTGGFLLLTSPLRSGWAAPPPNPSEGRPALRPQLPALLSLSLTVALAGFFLLYVSVFTSDALSAPLTSIPEGQHGHEAAEMPVVVGLAAYLVTTALLVVPLLFVLRRGRAPRGAVPLVVAPVAWLSAGVEEFPSHAVAGAAAITVAAVVIETLLDRLDATRGAAAPGRLAVAGALTAAVLWAAQIAAVSAVDVVRWPVELWAGVILLSALAGAVLGLLATPYRSADVSTRGRDDVSASPES